MSEIYGTVGTSNYTQLLADPQGADIISIPCTPGKGTIKRGTVMARDTSTGYYTAAAAADIVSTKMLVVLNEDVATGDSTATVVEEAAAYRAGAFIDGKVLVSDGTAVTAAQKIILRQQNIVFDVKA